MKKVGLFLKELTHSVEMQNDDSIVRSISLSCKNNIVFVPSEMFKYPVYKIIIDNKEYKVSRGFFLNLYHDLQTRKIPFKEI